MVHLPRRKAPLTPSVLLQFNAHLDLRDSAHLALWSAYLVGFFSFFRTANLVPPSLDTFSSRNTLSRNSITFNSSSALITITGTKTRQAGDAGFPFPRILGSPLCPTFALKSLLRTVPAPDTHPLFSFLSPSHQLAYITSNSFSLCEAAFSIMVFARKHLSLYLVPTAINESNPTGSYLFGKKTN